MIGSRRPIPIVETEFTDPGNTHKSRCHRHKFQASPRGNPPGITTLVTYQSGYRPIRFLRIDGRGNDRHIPRDARNLPQSFDRVGEMEQHTSAKRQVERTDGLGREVINIDQLSSDL